MASKTFRGVPVNYTDGWVVLRRAWDGSQWFPILDTVRGTRRQAINAFDAFTATGMYQRWRKRGIVKAVHCIIEPVTFGK